MNFHAGHSLWLRRSWAGLSPGCPGSPRAPHDRAATWGPEARGSPSGPAPAQPSKSSLTSAPAGRSRRPGAAPAPHPGARFSRRRGRSPARFFSRLGLRARPGDDRDFSRSTATYCPQRGTAGPGPAGLGNCRGEGRPQDQPRSLCLEPGSPFVLSTAWQLWGSNPARRPAPLCTAASGPAPGPLARTHMALTVTGPCVSGDRNTRARPLFPTGDLTVGLFRALKILLLGLRARLWPLRLDRVWVFHRRTAVRVLAPEDLELCVPWKSDLILSPASLQPSLYSLDPLCHPHLGHEF